MKRVIKRFITLALLILPMQVSSMKSWTTGNNGIPSGWSINETESGTTNSDNDNPQPGGNNEGSDSDTSGNYLTFVAIDSGTFKLSVNAVSYSLDNGRTWTTLASNTNSPTVQSGKKIMWKGALTPIEDKGIGKFSSSGQFDIEGNIMSLLYDDNFEGVSSLAGKDYAFSSLFSGCTGLISAENLVLPATTLAKNCYMCMFLDCSSLTTVPELPATTLADGCYSGMFGKCTSLTSVPSNYLPVTTLANSCYNGMFHNCTSLTTAPMLPATTLATSCYQYMFTHCTSLTTAPVLPATTLANSCYDNMFCYCTSLTTAPSLPATTVVYYCYLSMFYGCTSLTTAPELPATTLAVGCYELMFAGCSRLNYINCLATNISSKYCTDNWVQGVSSSGTFVKAPSASWTTGNNGIPSGWSVYDTESGTTNSDNDGNDAYAFKINGINYKIVKGNNVEVTGADWETSYKGTITIPSSLSYNGTDYSVVGIGAYAFHGSELHSISLPSSVVSIGKEAFSDCSELSSITLPDNLKIIGDYAFCDSGLKTIAIPNSVSSIGFAAFSSCPISEIVIPNSVTTMGGYVLAHCDNLKSVILSNSIKELPHSCFYNCDELTSITIPAGVEKISWDAFQECKNLQLAFIPNTVKEIDSNVFLRCYSLVSIDIPNSVTSIGAGAFQECENLKYVNLPDNITTLPEDLFEKCISLESIDLPNGIWTIGEGAFSKCSSLKTIILPEKLKRIENHVFSNCISLETVIIPKNVKYVGSTFRNCKNLLNVYCYATEVPDIYDSAFEGSDVVYAKLYVPQESVNQYKKAPTWSDFGVILPIEGDYNDISTTSQSSILIHNDGNTIVVEGLVEEAPVTIYNLSGHVVYSEQDVKGNIRIETNMRVGEAAIIKIGDLTRKTIIK